MSENKKKFNFESFLIEKKYSKDVFKGSNGQPFATNFQRKLSLGIWNGLTIHENGLMSCASPLEGLFMINGDQPKTEAEALELLIRLEKVESDEK